MLDMQYYVYVNMNKNKSETMLKPLMTILESNSIEEEKSDLNVLNRKVTRYTEETSKEVIGRLYSEDIEKTAEFLRSLDGVTKVTYMEIPHHVRFMEDIRPYTKKGSSRTPESTGFGMVI